MWRLGYSCFREEPWRVLGQITAGPVVGDAEVGCVGEPAGPCPWEPSAPSRPVPAPAQATGPPDRPGDMADVGPNAGLWRVQSCRPPERHLTWPGMVGSLPALCLQCCALGLGELQNYLFIIYLYFNSV